MRSPRWAEIQQSAPKVRLSPETSRSLRPMGSRMISRGEIYFITLSPTHGREQAGRRPVLVVSADAINRQPLVVTVVVGTGARNVPRDYPTNVRVTARETGLPIDTVFLCFQIRSLDPPRFFDPKTHRPNLAGTIPPARIEEVAVAPRMGLNL